MAAVCNQVIGERRVPDANFSDAQFYEIGYALPPEGVERLGDLVDHPCIGRCPETSQEYDGCLR